MRSWLDTGGMHAAETMVHGLGAMPAAFAGMFEGTNMGKLVVKLSD